jgi:hypothetical protein
MPVAGLSATIVPWLELHRGRSMRLALTGARVGAMCSCPSLGQGHCKLGICCGHHAIGALGCRLYAAVEPRGTQVSRTRRV